jgi:hypothetical protein
VRLLLLLLLLQLNLDWLQQRSADDLKKRAGWLAGFWLRQQLGTQFIAVCFTSLW